MIVKQNNVVFGAGTMPRSMWSGTGNLNDVLLNLAHQETQNNQIGELAQPSATYWPLSARFRWTEKFEGVAMAVLLQFEVKGVAIFINNSQGEQLIQPSVVAFFHIWIVYNTVAKSSQLPAVLLLTNQIQISLFAQLSCAKIKSAFDWSIAVQFGINLDKKVYSLTIHTLYIQIWLVV